MTDPAPEASPREASPPSAGPPDAGPPGAGPPGAGPPGAGPPGASPPGAEPVASPDAEPVAPAGTVPPLSEALAEAGLADDEPPPATPRGRLIAAAVPLLLGAAALVNSILLGIGSLTDPGAGLWPAGASGLMILGSVLLLIRWRSLNDGERFDAAGLRTIGLSLIFAGLFVILFGGMGSWPGTGFEWATALMLALWLKLIGRESWLMTAAVSVGVTAGLHLLFIELLKAPIPHTIG